MWESAHGRALAARWVQACGCCSLRGHGLGVHASMAARVCSSCNSVPPAHGVLPQACAPSPGQPAPCRPRASRRSPLLASHLRLAPRPGGCGGDGAAAGSAALPAREPACERARHAPAAGAVQRPPPRAGCGLHITSSSIGISPSPKPLKPCRSLAPTLCGLWPRAAPPSRCRPRGRRPPPSRRSAPRAASWWRSSAARCAPRAAARQRATTRCERPCPQPGRRPAPIGAHMGTSSTATRM